MRTQHRVHPTGGILAAKVEDMMLEQIQPNQIVHVPDLAKDPIRLADCHGPSSIDLGLAFDPSTVVTDDPP